MSSSSSIPSWTASGDWFDVCKCSIPCPCVFAQTPTYGDCDGVLAYHIKKGQYGEVSLDGLNVLAIGYFKGNIWAGETKFSGAFFFDERANEKQREALNMIFTGKAGGFMAEFAKLLGEVKGMDYAPIKFEVSDDLSYWSVEIPGKGVQTTNPPGSEVGPLAAGAVATWGIAVKDKVDATEVGYKWERTGNSSKHIPFDWSGP